MAELVIPPGYVHLTYYMQHTGIQHTALVTIGGKVESAPFTQASCNGAYATFADNLKPLYDAEITFTRCVALVGNDGPAGRFETVGTTVGTRAAGTSLPPAVSVVVRKTTAFSGRQYRGRMYLPWPSTLDIGQGGQWLTGRQAAWQTVLTTFYNALLSDVPTNLNEVSLLHADPLVGAAPSPTPITGLLVTTFAGTQRRRQDRS